MKHCLNPECNKEIPETKIDSKGRKNTRTSSYCSSYCRNLHLRKYIHPDYYKVYYAQNKEKYRKDLK